MANGDAAARSSSFYLIAKDVEQFMSVTTKKPKGMEIREWVHFLLGAFGKCSYKRGVRRGHIQSYKQYKATGRVSSRLVYQKEKEFFTNQVREVNVRSRIRWKHR